MRLSVEMSSRTKTLPLIMLTESDVFVCGSELTVKMV